MYLGAWPALLAAISLLLGLCALIIDLGNLFACSAGVTEQLMAITLIAIGTCLPGASIVHRTHTELELERERECERADTLASVHAARADRDADSSIGGVNGKKAVSVYLGIGLGWLIAAVYHVAAGETLHVNITRMGFALSLYILLTVRSALDAALHLT